MRHMKNVIKRAFGLTVAVCILLLAFSGCTKTPDVGQNSSTGSIGESSTNGESSAIGSVSSDQDFEYEVIDGKAFITNYKGNAENVVIPAEIDGISISPILSTWVFRGNKTIISVTIPEGITEIEERAFYECSSLESVTLPKSLTKIGSWAFYCCFSLASIELPPNLYYLGYMAFIKCTSLTSITIPKTVTKWGAMSFSYCTSLSDVKLEEGLSLDESDLAFTGCTSLTSFTFPSGITTIPSQFLMNCTSLTSVTIPEGVTSIEKSAFENTAISSIVIPKSVKTLERALDKCNSLSSVKFEGNPPEGLDRYTFSLVRNPDLILYYHEDAEGWTSPTFLGFPTQTW